MNEPRRGGTTKRPKTKPMRNRETPPYHRTIAPTGISNRHSKRGTCLSRGPRYFSQKYRAGKMAVTSNPKSWLRVLLFWQAHVSCKGGLRHQTRLHRALLVRGTWRNARLRVFVLVFLPALPSNQPRSTVQIGNPSALPMTHNSLMHPM